MLKHEQIEKSVGLLIVLTLLTVIWGGLLEIVPLFFQKSTTTPVEGTKPYDAVRLAGRDIYVREGCFLCHSQMIRPFRAETERYGHYSVAGEYVYDHPFQWGSKRTGPDLHRVGVKYPEPSWHWKHMMEPTSTSPNSIMPAYTWLYERDLDTRHTEGKILTMQKLGTPYPEGYASVAINDLRKQAGFIADKLKAAGMKDVNENKEIIALIAYLHKLGTDIDPATKAKVEEWKAEVTE